MSNELLTILEYIEQERGISRDVLVHAVETALLSAARKSIHPASNLTVKVDPETGTIRAWAKLEVVEVSPNNDQILLKDAHSKLQNVKIGEFIDWEVTPSNFGRIAALSAKQAIMQHLRQAEKETVRKEFASQMGQIINGTVRRIEHGNIIIDFQKAEGVLSNMDKIPGENYVPGDRINVLLVDVDSHSSGPSLIVSRSNPDFVKRLFEREVSEIHDGIVEIMSIARDPGNRTKIAVKSNEDRVDPVGACVGMRGMRVKNIMSELNNERIDIIPFDDDIKQYAMNALQPAKVQSVTVKERNILHVSVTPEQSNLACGKKLQNINLASKLLKYKIVLDIETPKKVESMEEKINKASKHLSDVFGISDNSAHRLVENGFVSPEDLKAAGQEQLANITGIEPGDIELIITKLQ